MSSANLFQIWSIHTLLYDKELIFYKTTKFNTGPNSTVFQTIQGFYDGRKEAFENMVWKGENAGYCDKEKMLVTSIFSFFEHCFLPFPTQILIYNLIYFTVDLDNPEILLFGKDLKHLQLHINLIWNGNGCDCL